MGAERSPGFDFDLGCQLQCAKVPLEHTHTQWFLAGALPHHACLCADFDARHTRSFFATFAASRRAGLGAFGLCGTQFARGHRVLRHSFVNAIFKLGDLGVWSYLHPVDLALERA